MNGILKLLISAIFVFANIDAKIDVKELRCLVCQATLEELDIMIQEIDPVKTVDIGGYRLDASGNLKRKTVSQAKSEIHISDLIDTVCAKMDDYIRATWKHNGQLTIFRLIIDGKMNPDMSKVDVIADDDLNKSLQFYCEGIVEEYEDIIVKHYINGSDNIDIRVCSEEAKLCSHTLPEPEDYINEEL